MPIDKPKLVKPTVEKVPATEKSFSCPNGYDLAVGGGYYPIYGSSDIITIPNDSGPKYDVRIGGVGYDFVIPEEKDFQGHVCIRNDSQHTSGSDQRGPGSR